MINVFLFFILASLIVFCVMLLDEAVKGAQSLTKPKIKTHRR